MAWLSPVALQEESAGNAPLVKVLNEIRTWLDSERVEPVRFKMVVSRSGLGFEISFRNEHEAERFQERFASLLNAEAPTARSYRRRVSTPPASGVPDAAHVERGRFP
jgi:type II secretory pathway component PulL